MDADAPDRDQVAHEGFDAFVAARGPALWRTATLLTGDRQRAEDLVQTALGKAWPHWRRVQASGSFEAYTCKVMLTTYLAWWRRNWNGGPTAHLPRIAEPDGGPELAVRHDLMAALRSLPRRQCAVVVLRYYEDLSEVRVAELLGISVGVVKSDAAHALATLRQSAALTSGEWVHHDR